mmetsp:Transcript_4576/g.9486  ORF Transcript_4576/g.9486 Transcript_4576/m.9486 type:complete len:107 (+) Transcript_4576:1996-2316(+)
MAKKRAGKNEEEVLTSLFFDHSALHHVDESENLTQKCRGFMHDVNRAYARIPARRQRHPDAPLPDMDDTMSFTALCSLLEQLCKDIASLWVSVQQLEHRELLHVNE